MAVLAVITLPSTGPGPDSVPRRLLEQVPDVELEVKSLVPIGDAASPYFWAWGESVDELERVLVADPEVEDVSCIERVDGGALFSVEWAIDDPVVKCLSRTNGALMEAYGTATEWTLTIWFEGGDDAAAFQRCCNERNISFDIERLRSVADVATGGTLAITAAQREALVVAYEGGFFDQPRRTTQAEIAEELGLSSAAVGNRIRRGTANLIEETLVTRAGGENR